MKTIVQRVNSASVFVNKDKISKISKGILVFLGIENGDNKKDLEFMVNKVSNLRIFEDNNHKMNQSIKNINGEILVVSQFTLCADTKKGHRPSFNNAAQPDFAENIYNLFCNELIKSGISTAKGKFGAEMNVFLENDGPVTIILDSNS